MVHFGTCVYHLSRLKGTRHNRFSEIETLCTSNLHYEENAYKSVPLHHDVVMLKQTQRRLWASIHNGMNWRTRLISRWKARDPIFRKWKPYTFKSPKPTTITTSGSVLASRCLISISSAVALSIQCRFPDDSYKRINNPSGRLRDRRWSRQSFVKGKSGR